MPIPKIVIPPYRVNINPEESMTMLQCAKAAGATHFVLSQYEGGWNIFDNRASIPCHQVFDYADNNDINIMLYAHHIFKQPRSSSHLNTNSIPIRYKTDDLGPTGNWHPGLVFNQTISMRNGKVGNLPVVERLYYPITLPKERLYHVNIQVDGLTNGCMLQLMWWRSGNKIMAVHHDLTETGTTVMEVPSLETDDWELFARILPTNSTDRSQVMTADFKISSIEEVEVPIGDWRELDDDRYSYFGHKNLHSTTNCRTWAWWRGPELGRFSSQVREVIREYIQHPSFKGFFLGGDESYNLGWDDDFINIYRPTLKDGIINYIKWLYNGSPVPKYASVGHGYVSFLETLNSIVVQEHVIRRQSGLWNMVANFFMGLFISPEDRQKIPSVSFWADHLMPSHNGKEYIYANNPHGGGFTTALPNLKVRDNYLPIMWGVKEQNLERDFDAWRDRGLKVIAGIHLSEKDWEVLMWQRLMAKGKVPDGVAVFGWADPKNTVPGDDFWRHKSVDYLNSCLNWI